PRGWWHDVIPLENQETFHVAVGLHPPHAIDYIKWAVGNLLPQHLEGRHALRSTNPQDAVKEATQKLAEILVTETNIVKFLEEANNLERPNSPFAIEKYGRKFPRPPSNGVIILSHNNSQIGVDGSILAG